VLIGTLGLMARRSLDAEAARLMDLARRAGEQLAALVEDALDLGAVESGRLAIVPAPLKVRQLAETAAAAHRVRAREKDLDLSVTVDDGVPAAVRADARRVGQILNNFLGNAVKFTEKGVIRLRVMVRDTPPLPPSQDGLVRLRFVVADSGPGIDPDFAAKIFERFTRDPAAVERLVPGAGLGLAIAKELAHAMGGEVGYTSTAGCGTDFWLELAVPVVPEEKVEPVEAAGPVETRVSGGVALLVDDNADNLRLGEAMAKAVGCGAVVAQNGEEALWVEQRENPDVIFLDYRMPVMDGLEAARRLRCRGVLAPIILLTANADTRLREQSRLMGVDEVVMKPLRLRDLRKCLDRYLSEAPAEVA
jgi:CheY-like chemotaxis protein